MNVEPSWLVRHYSNYLQIKASIYIVEVVFGKLFVVHWKLYLKLSLSFDNIY